MSDVTHCPGNYTPSAPNLDANGVFWFSCAANIVGSTSGWGSKEGWPMATTTLRDCCPNSTIDNPPFEDTNGTYDACFSWCSMSLEKDTSNRTYHDFRTCLSDRAKNDKNDTGHDGYEFNGLTCWAVVDGDTDFPGNDGKSGGARQVVLNAGVLSIVGLMAGVWVLGLSL